ncbi:predicted membrane protein [Longilinea arvoryzae]|uniref:Predicted membrane protein n=1 Tax=Longilinea arvoryzae TaxID=360412 RepID=A0A0K8MZC2_9CHLR|nr:YccF domain-containing protein [Longilinea arvoryzae]GAP15982.1 predicted membrane protein [Longilinea arvoryzae]
MSFLGNLLWFLLGGFIPFLLYLVAGIVLCVTIIGIPFGVQCFKLAGLSAFPFGRDVEIGQFGAFGLIGNILWIMLAGWELAITHIVLGLIFYITIIGIPFGRQHFKLARLAFVPFGATIR